MQSENQNQLEMPRGLRFALIGGVSLGAVFGFITAIATALLGHVRPSWMEQETAWFAAALGFVVGLLGGLGWAAIHKAD